MIIKNISVKEHHILCGERMNCFACPVALAILEAVGKKYVQVTSKYITVGNDQQLTPKSVSDFMYNFDARVAVQPFSFDLELLC